MTERPTGPLPSGSTIGILGGGQLGRMLSVAASRLGYRTHVFEPGAAPAADVSADWTQAPYDDLAAAFTGYAFRNSGPPTRAQVTTIGNDVWIGHGALVRAGVTIGDGAVVAAHAVVARDVPAYAVVAGNPATIKKFRFPPVQIGQLMHAAWWRYAPWQLQHLDMARPMEVARGVNAMVREGVPFFEPSIVDLREDRA